VAAAETAATGAAVADGDGGGFQHCSFSFCQPPCLVWRVPNGYVYNCISVTNTFLSCTNANFSQADVGKRIIINHCGTNGQFYIGTILAVYSPITLRLTDPVVNALTNLSYAILYTQDSAVANTIAAQNWLNSVSNGFGGQLIVDPPLYYTEVLGMSQVGSCYVLTTNGDWQRPTENNAMLIVPPLLASNPNNYGGRAEVDIEGYEPYKTWGYGPDESYIQFPPSASVFVVAAIGNDKTGTNWIGNSFLDCRAFGTAEYFSANPTGTTGIPDNDCAVILHNLTILESYDSHICAVNLAGGADGSGLDNCQIIGGDCGSTDLGTSYYWSLRQYPRGTNSIAVIMPANYEGTFGFMNYDNIGGEYIGVECGNVIGEQDTIGDVSNAVDFGYSSSVETEFNNLNLTGEFNVFNAPVGVNEGPVTVYASIISLGANVMPQGSHINLIDDQYFEKDGIHDTFFYSSGEIDVNTNINNGVPIDFDSWAGSNLKIVLIGQSPGQPAQDTVLFGDQNYSDMDVTNLTISGNATFQGTARPIIDYFGNNGLEFDSAWSEIVASSSGSYQSIGFVHDNAAAGVYSGLAPISSDYTFFANRVTSQYEGIMNSNGMFQAAGTVVAPNSTQPFSWERATNGMKGVMYFQIPSNGLYFITGKYSNGTVYVQSMF
jgi:hypothetical protein